MSEVNQSHTITVRRDYRVYVGDQFAIDAWHEDGQASGHLVLSVPDSIAGSRRCIDAHLKKEQLEALRDVINAMLAGWDAEVPS